MTETALKIKQREQVLQTQKDKSQQSSQDNTNFEFASSTLHRKKRLFDGPENVINPLKPRHIEEAWRVLQTIDMRHRALTNFKGGRLSSKPIIM